MKIVPGNEYHALIKVKAPIVGNVKIDTHISVDSDTAFHGYGIVLGRTVRFDKGDIEGKDYKFAVTIKKIVINISAQINEDGTITGGATAAHYRPMKVTGEVIE